MKRAGNLWPEVVSWNSLLDAAIAAARGKKNRPNVARFLFRLEPNLCELQRDLETGCYAPGAYRSFWIHDPKARLISAAPFRDRVIAKVLSTRSGIGGKWASQTADSKVWIGPKKSAFPSPETICA